MAQGEPTDPDVDTVVFDLVGPLVSGDVPILCTRARELLRDVEVGRPVVCDVGRLGTPDAVALDALARLQLTARRMGHHVRLRAVSPELRAMLSRAGLCRAVLADPASAVQAEREPEEGEEPGRVEEGREGDDPSL